MDDTPENLAGMAYFEIEEYRVAEYHPLPDGRGLPTQVHVLFQIRGIAEPLVLRIKSRQAAREMIAALKRHTENVWPS
jgi:hypothetical protein